MATVLLVLLTVPQELLASGGKKNNKVPTVRWSEDRPGCTFSTTQDGKYQYGVWSGDIGIVLSVDAGEIQFLRHRIEPILLVHLMVRYRGASALEIRPDDITLQFMKHFKIMQPALDPDDYTQKIQADADALDDEARRAIARHPEEMAAREARLQEYKKEVNDLIEFLGKNGLRQVQLDHANAETVGWVFFNTANKWLGGWKAQEEFVLRMPLAGTIFEFPFKLPPKAGELLLRKRE
jgi:hypothetical protein